MTDIQTMRLAIKEAKSIMAEYPHMENDEDFVPEIAWILFLNVFEYFEKKRHALDSNYKKIIPEECSWDYWVIDEKDIFTDDDLTTHLNSKVLPKLKNLDGSKENKNIDVVRSVFKDFSLRIDDGITLRRILDKLKIIKINEVNDLVNLSKVYDEELEKMKYAAGKKASFITVRPIVNFIVEQLKPNYRNLVKLRYFKEMSYEEISQELDMPLGTVKAQLHRSRERLFNIMSGTKGSF